MNADTSLAQITYFSLRADHVSDADLVDSMILPAMRKNRLLQITGCLWYNEHHFFQTLEASPATLQRLFSAIQRDPRHHSISILSEGPVDARAYPESALKLVDARKLSDLDALAQRILQKHRLRRRQRFADRNEAVQTLLARLRPPSPVVERPPTPVRDVPLP